MTPETVTRFAVGNTYTARSIGDYNCIISATVIKRTTKTVTANVDGEIKTFRPGIYDGAEYFMPWGSFSMCPSIRANAATA